MCLRHRRHTLVRFISISLANVPTSFLNVGDVIKLSFDIESREYMGRWFTSIRGWKAEAATPNYPGQPMQAPAAPAAFPEPAAPAFPTASEPAPTDDLPF